VFLKSNDLRNETDTRQLMESLFWSQGAGIETRATNQWYQRLSGVDAVLLETTDDLDEFGSHQRS